MPKRYKKHRKMPLPKSHRVCWFCDQRPLDVITHPVDDRDATLLCRGCGRRYANVSYIRVAAAS